MSTTSKDISRAGSSLEPLTYFTTEIAMGDMNGGAEASVEPGQEAGVEDEGIGISSQRYFGELGSQATIQQGPMTSGT